MNVFFAAVLAQVNHYLSPSGIYLHQYVALIVFPVFFLRLLPAAVVVFCTGLFFEVLSPYGFGQLATLMLGAAFLLVLAKDRIRRENEVHIALVAAGVNILFMMLAGLLYAHGDIFSNAYWTAVTLEMMLSTVVTLASAPIIAAFLQNLFLSIGVDLGAELRES